MNITVSGVSRVAAATAETHAPDMPASVKPRASDAYSLVEIDSATNLPKPPRYPWLSRLATELEPAAKQKPPFPSTPQLGEHIDQAA